MTDKKQSPRGPKKPSLDMINDAVKDAIAKAHEAGLYTTHRDTKGEYRIYPNGEKVYIKLER